MTAHPADPGGGGEGRRAPPGEDAARAVLGGVLVHGDVAVRIVEVEAYGGPPTSAHPDPAAHTWRGPTARNAVMFGDAGHLYVYLSHGIHHCVNVTCRPAGEGGGVLLRAARVEDGHDVVAERRPGVPVDRAARGPGNLGRTLGITLGDGGADLLHASSHVTFRPDSVPASAIRVGPRVGVSSAADRPWRLWIADAREVSAYRRSPRALRPPHVGVDPAHGGQWRP